MLMATSEAARGGSEVGRPGIGHIQPRCVSSATSASQAWNDIEQQIYRLTSSISRENSAASAENEANAASIRSALARLRSRQEQMAALSAGHPPSAEVTFQSGEGDVDLQRLWHTMQDNVFMRTQIHQNQRLVAEREAEASRLTHQVDEVKRRRDDSVTASFFGQQASTASVSSTQPRDTESAAEVSACRQRLSELQMRTFEKEALLKRAQQRLLEDVSSSRQKSAARMRLTELRRNLEIVEEQKVVYATEVADCHVRLGTAAAERGELEQRLLILRQCKEQIDKDASASAAEAATLKERLARLRTECRRHEQQDRLYVAELARLRTPTLIPPEVCRTPSKQLEAHPHLATQLEAASAHNEWLREQLQQLSGCGGALPSHALVASAEATAPQPAAPPEATPEAAPVHPLVTAPELDSTILALEAQMNALAAQNEALERNFARKSDLG